jgi:hypothetical protein
VLLLLKGAIGVVTIEGSLHCSFLPTKQGMTSWSKFQILFFYFFISLAQRHESNRLSKLLSKKILKMTSPTITT